MHNDELQGLLREQEKYKETYEEDLQVLSKTFAKDIHNLEEKILNNNDEKNQLLEEMSKLKNKCAILEGDQQALSMLDLQNLEDLSSANNKTADAINAAIQAIKLCPICMATPIRDIVLVPCGHTFCSACMQKYTNPNCPCCKIWIENKMRMYSN